MELSLTKIAQFGVVTEWLDEERQRRIKKITWALHELFEKLRQGICSFHCDAFRLGVLVKSMTNAHLYPRPCKPFLDTSVQRIISMLNVLRQFELEEACLAEDTGRDCQTVVVIVKLTEYIKQPIRTPCKLHRDLWQ